MQVLAARCSAEIDAAHALNMVTARGDMRKIEEGGTLSNADRLTGRRNVAFAAQLALRAGTRLFNAAGGNAVYLKGAMQRQFRNLLGAAAHRGVTWESSAADYGAALLEHHGAPRRSPGS
jgi:3-hydroxy-9,10-secoandrosta-1,3,5(10)-triene-9,17-dione monooxygenase